VNWLRTLLHTRSTSLTRKVFNSKPIFDCQIFNTVPKLELQITCTRQHRSPRIMGSCRGFKDECKIPQLLLVCRLQQLRLVTYGCSFTSGRVIKYALLFCTFLSLFCSCLTSALAPAPAPAPAIPPFPVPVADLPGSWNTTVIGSSRFYYETKEVDAMQSLLAHWSNTATNSFSYNLPGWTSQPDLNYPCFEQADWQGVACYAFEGTYKGTTYFIVTVGYR
jgi:hypothetical protein